MPAAATPSSASPPSAVFIAGSPRSGTSIFFKTLSGHPAFAMTTVLSRRFGGRVPPGMRLFHALGIGSRPVEAGRIWRSFHPDTETEVTEQHLSAEDRQRLTALVSNHCRLFGRPTFLSKWPGHALRIRWTAAALPDSRFIHCLRDGRAVANSILRECKKADTHWSLNARMWPELAALDYASFSGAIWARVARACTDSLASLPPERAMTMRYEDFMAEPIATLERVAAFCGVPFGPEHHAMIPRLNDRNDRWKNEMSAEEQAAMLREAGPELEALGYGD